MHQLLFYNDDLNVLVASICTIEENTEASVFFSNEIGLELNDKKTIWSCLETSMQCKISTYKECSRRKCHYCCSS